MKLNWKSMSITVGLLIVLGIVVFIEIGLFVSGPTRKYEQRIAKQEMLITKEYKDIKNVTRHVFKYTTYSGEDDHMIMWFNEKGKCIVSKKKSSLKIEEVKQVVQGTYGANKVEVTLGYGYKNPVYVIHSDIGDILLDYDSLKEVYFLEGGEA